MKKEDSPDETPNFEQQDFCIGKTGGNDWFTGYIDVVRVWNLPFSDVGILRRLNCIQFPESVLR